VTKSEEGKIFGASLIQAPGLGPASGGSKKFRQHREKREGERGGIQKAECFPTDEKRVGLQDAWCVLRGSRSYDRLGCGGCGVLGQDLKLVVTAWGGFWV